MSSEGISLLRNEVDVNRSESSDGPAAGKSYLRDCDPLARDSDTRSWLLSLKRVQTHFFYSLTLLSSTLTKTTPWDFPKITLISTLRT